MPQFLRCIKVLCLLYPFYKQTVSAQSPNTLPNHSSPTRRTDSIGGHLDRPNPPRARSFLNSWAGHRRTGSTHDELDDQSKTEIDDPFEKLEMIWTSLESWFDLLLTEILKLSDQKLQEHKIDLTTTSSDTTQLAAAIILSAPPKRREVFLKASISFDNSQQVINKSQWRRSWHAERYVRVTPLAEEQDSPSSLPSYNRSKSTEMANNDTGTMIIIVNYYCYCYYYYL